MFRLKFIKRNSLATIKTIICFTVAFILVLSPVAQPFLAFAEELLPTVQFATDSSTITETESTFIHIITVDYIPATPPAISNTTVIYEVMPGSATLDNDYYVASPIGALVFDPLVPTSQLLYIDIIGDTVPEGDEDFSIVLKTITNGIIGTPSTHTITIQDYDPSLLPTVQFNTDSSTVTETESTFIHIITVDYIPATPPAISNTTVIYEVMPGSATLDNDYYVASPIGALVFDPLVPTSQLLYIDIIGDTVPEGDEDFSIVLKTITNGIIGTPSTHTVTILDDDESGDSPENPDEPEVTPNPPVPCGENSILNGDFEYPGIDLSYSWDVFELNSSLTDWFGYWMPDNPESYGGSDEPNPALLELQARVNGWQAQSGDQYAELDSDWGGPTVGLSGEPASLSIYQDLSTNINRYYEVSFYFSPRPNTALTDNRLEFSWGGDIIEIIEAEGMEDINWTKYEYVLQADSDLTRIQFSDLGIPNSLGTFIDNIEAIEICDLDCEDLEGKNGWYGEYFNYSINHIDMGIPSTEWPDKTHGDPLGAWTADWYDAEYYRFNQIDTNLEFGEDFFPFDAFPEEIHSGHDYHFGTHWSAKVTVPIAGDYNYTLTSDDDTWVYVDGNLIADNSGIHPLQTINDSVELTDEHIVDVFFAERHTVGSHLYFIFEDQRILIEPYNEDCEEGDVCISGPGWADVVEGYNQGTTKGGGAVATDRSNSEVILDEADGVFFSLGMGGTITASFEGYVLDVEGEDLSFHEITYDRDGYPEETAFVEVSQDEVDWYELGAISNHVTDGIFYLDINSTGLSWIKYVRITDTTDYELHQDGADGYDLDAIDAIYEACYYIGLEKHGEFNPLTGKITYTIDGLLEGDGTIYDPIVVDYLPEGTSFVWANGIGDYNKIDHTVTWDLTGVTANSNRYHTWTVIVALNEFLNMDVWADAFIEPFNQGLRKDGQPVLLERSDPNNALGEAQDNDTINFVSLGFGGDIILEFDNYIINGAGDDVEIVETSFGNPNEISYPETAKIYASQSGNDWTYLDTIILDGTVDLGALEWAKYIKLVDVSDPEKFSNSTTTDGFDVDGVKAIYSLPSICSIDNTAVGRVNTEPEGEGEVVWVKTNTTTIINEFACEPEEENVTIIAHKIVCNSEDMLPNWGDGGADITATTAQDWVDNHEGCHFVEGWDFQWGPENSYDPGDTKIGPADAPWQTMSPTDAVGMTTVILTPEQVGNNGYFWFREVLQEGYIPFTHDQNNNSNIDPVSAEMYCHIDVFNYDNYDRIDGVKLGQTYNCVAFNVLSKTPEYTISGMKFNDFDGDGIKNNNDSGLEGWTIYAGKFIETLEVNANGSVIGTPIDSMSLTSGQKYFLRVSSTFNAGDLITADAKYSVREPNTEWTDIVQNYKSWGPTLLDLHIDDIAPDWGSYMSSHVYWHTVLGDGNPATFQIYDIYASNNVGTLMVDIYKVVAEDITDSDGNYWLDLTGVEGEVVIAEETQSGWVQTAPSPDGFYTVSAGDASTGLDFGNQEGDEDDEGDGDEGDGDEGDGGSTGGGGGGGGGYYTPPVDDEDDDGEVLGDEDENQDDGNEGDGSGEDSDDEGNGDSSDNPGDTQGGSSFSPSSSTGGDGTDGTVLGEEDEDPEDGGIVEGDVDGQGGPLPFYLNFINYLWLLLLILLLLLLRMIYKGVRRSSR